MFPVVFWGVPASVLVVVCSLFNSVVDFRYNVACVAAWCSIGLFVFGVTSLWVWLLWAAGLLLCLVGFALLVSLVVCLLVCLILAGFVLVVD